MWPAIGAAISGGASLLGSYLTGQSNKENAERNIALQREFAQNAIQWKVQDAQKAGIHPLYALGAQTHGFSPVSVGDTSVGSGLRGMGQDISRAVSAYRSPEEKTAGAALAEANIVRGDALRLENLDLQNQILKAKLALVSQPGTPPGVDFPVAEGTKPETNPPIMAGGSRVNPDAGYSPMEAWEKRYGDEGPIASVLPVFIALEDAQKNYGPYATWPAQLVRAAAARFGQEVVDEWQNFKRFIGR